MLLACGADAIAENVERDTGLRIAESGTPNTSWAFHCPWCAHLMSPDNDGHTVLYDATWSGNEDMIQLLLDHGADVAKFASGGLTILHIATREGHSAAIKLLLENSVDPMSQDGAEEASLHWAIFSMNEAVVKVPLDSGLEPDVMSI